MLRGSLQEQPEKKLADFNEAVKLVPGDADTVRARGEALAQMDKPELALADLDKAIQLKPDDASAYEDKAKLLDKLKKYDQALAVLEKVQQLRPDSVEPWLQRAVIHSHQHKPDAALDDLDRALAMQPGNVAVLLLRASVYQEKGDKKKALADADEALRLRPSLPVAIRTRALLLADDGRLDEAAAELEKLLQLDPNDTLTLLQLGVLQIARKPAKAIETFSAVLAAEPDQWQALRGRGDAYLNLGRQAEAVADYEKALKLQPKDQGILNNLAWVLATSPDAKLRDGRRAVRLATAACEATDYKLAYILSTLAAAYAETGDFQSAVKWSAKAVQIGDKEHGGSLKKELESYKAHKPWRELLSDGKPQAMKPEKKKEAMSLLQRILRTHAPAAIILLRLMVGGVFLSEGIQKFVFPHELGAGRFVKIGIPAPEVMAPFVGVVETLGGSLVILGLCTRPAALLLWINISVALLSTKLPILLGHGFWRFSLPPPPAPFHGYGFWPVAHEARTDLCMWLGSLLLLFVGAGWLSLDAFLTRKEPPRTDPSPPDAPARFMPSARSMCRQKRSRWRSSVPLSAHGVCRLLPRAESAPLRPARAGCRPQSARGRKSARGTRPWGTAGGPRRGDRRGRCPRSRPPPRRAAQITRRRSRRCCVGLMSSWLKSLLP